MSQSVTLVTLAAAGLELGLCGYYWQAAFADVRPWLPYPLQEQATARLALDRYIFRSVIPHGARRRYLLAHIFGTLGLASLTLLALANGSAAGALAFAAVTVLALGQTVANWRKNHHLLQPKPSPPASAP